MFLRTLGDFKIPAVVERRRKELLVRLEEAEGDTRREKPRKLEETIAQESAVATPPVVKKAKDEKEKSKKDDEKNTTHSGSSSGVTSPNRRDSKINSLVSGFETIHAVAKKEEVEQTPKKWQVELRKTRKPADFPAEERKSEEPEPEPESEKTESVKTDPKEDSNELSSSLKEPEKGSIQSLDTTATNESDASTPKAKKSSKLNVFRIRGGRGKSPAPSRKEIPVTKEADETDTSAKQKTEEPEVPEAAVEEEEEGIRVSGKLEYKVKTRLSSKFVSKDVKLKETTLYIGDKDTLAMLGCTVQRTDSGFELFSHSAQKSHTFKVTEGGDEAKEKWLTTLQAAIDEVTPNEEGEISLYE